MPKASTATPKGPVTDAEYQMLAKFRRALRSFLHFSEEAAKAAGITPAQHQLMLTIRGAEEGEAPTIGDVAGWMKLRHHSTVELVDRAEAAGLVKRIQDEEDQRRTIEKVQEDINAGNWRTSRWFPSSARGNSDNIRAKGTFS